MAGPIEPPILMSRLMTFVFASALAAVLVLVLSISRISPLDRTQIFFLTSSPRDLSEIKIRRYEPTAGNMQFFKENFVREYIRARNDIFPNLEAMRRKWSEQVFVWSGDEVYSAFTKTYAFNVIMGQDVELDFRCFTEMLGAGARHHEYDQEADLDRYIATFRYVCTFENEALSSADYLIHVGVRFQDTVQWSERLLNPLGVYVAEYKIMNGAADPLDAQPFR